MRDKLAEIVEKIVMGWKKYQTERERKNAVNRDISLFLDLKYEVNQCPWRKNFVIIRKGYDSMLISDTTVGRGHPDALYHFYDEVVRQLVFLRDNRYMKDTFLMELDPLPPQNILDSVRPNSETGVSLPERAHNRHP